jgi:hypothetical protein
LTAAATFETDVLLVEPNIEGRGGNRDRMWFFDSAGEYASVDKKRYTLNHNNF